ncbi:hypothetical protein SARC_17700, partial [Sphaeroforma arctica JP610]
MAFRDVARLASTGEDTQQPSNNTRTAKAFIPAGTVTMATFSTGSETGERALTDSEDTTRNTAPYYHKQPIPHPQNRTGPLDSARDGVNHKSSSISQSPVVAGEVLMSDFANEVTLGCTNSLSRRAMRRGSVGGGSLHGRRGSISST